MAYQSLNLTTQPNDQAIRLKTDSTNRLVALDPDRTSSQAAQFEAELRARVIGQERAVRKLASLYQVFQAGLANPARPLCGLSFSLFSPRRRSPKPLS